MRTIKFRGKRRDNDEWIADPSILIDDGERVGIMDSTEGLFVDVYPHTLGQYSGFKDYNGNDIYEGDILYCSIADCRHAYREVVFHRGGFCLRDWFSTTPIANHNIKAWEIVGNIYDNPELVNIVNGRKGGKQ